MTTIVPQSIVVAFLLLPLMAKSLRNKRDVAAYAKQQQDNSKQTQSKAKQSKTKSYGSKTIPEVAQRMLSISWKQKMENSVRGEGNRVSLLLQLHILEEGRQA